MCGIAGYILKSETGRSADYIRALAKGIRHRGPDDEGCCIISRATGAWHVYKGNHTVASVGQGCAHMFDDQSIAKHDLCFAHTRYSIIDLSDAAHQPFFSADGSLVCVFNGEIYNYIELRQKLMAEGIKFKTASDTEVLVEGYRFLGDAVWSMLNGFWAVAIYDFLSDTIVFARDRIGVAPLYYLELPEGFFFASTIGALLDIYPGNVEFDWDVINGFIETGIKDHENSTFYTQIRSLPASTAVTFDKRLCGFQEANEQKYWDYPSARLTPADISFDEATQRFRETLFDAVELRLRADVPVAFELSGGLDSSSVVAAAAVLRGENITTYTAKIVGADEEPYARTIRQRYAVDYRVIDKIEDDFVSDYEPFSRIMEEPYDNPNDYTHFRMLQKMKDQGTYVVVTGAGGDEVLAGYESAYWPKAYQELRKSGGRWHADWYEFRRRFRTGSQSWKTLRHYLVDTPDLLKRRFLKTENKVPSAFQSRAVGHRCKYGRLSFHEQSLYHFNVALVPYYMRSSDHFTMAIPIEHRFPLLDYRLVELGLQMPISYLFSGGWTKYLLRKAMEPYLPKAITWRKEKMGFTFPFKNYFVANRTAFAPLLAYLKRLRILQEFLGDYDYLLKQDPVLLWRLLSTAIWMKTQKDVPAS